MKILVIGPSPHMKHDPGKIVSDFLSCASRLHEVNGCFYHHDFNKKPIDFRQQYVAEGFRVNSVWIDPSKDNGAVIDAYDIIMDFSPEAVVSFGGFFEADFIRAAIETSGKNILWHHVMTMANHVHDARFSETFNTIGTVWSYSESQIENIVRMFGLDSSRVNLIKRNCVIPLKSTVGNVDVVCGGWNTESYNLKSVFEALSGFDVSVKCLTNYYEYGDFDLDIASRQYFSSNNIFPLEFGSLFELPEYSNWDYFIENCKIFIDMSMTQNGCSTLKRAILSKAACIIIDTPRHREIAREHENVILIKSSVFFSNAGLKLYIPDHVDLHLKIHDSLSCVNNFIKKSITHKEILVKEEEEFNNLLNNLLSTGSSGRFMGLESIT